MTQRNDPAEIIEQILGEADELIRRRLQELRLELPHLILAVTSDNKIVLRGNVSADVLGSFGQDLQDVAEELTAAAKPDDTTH